MCAGHNLSSHLLTVLANRPLCRVHRAFHHENVECVCLCVRERERGEGGKIMSAT